MLSIIHIVRGFSFTRFYKASKTFSNHRLENLSFNLHMSEFNNAHVNILFHSYLCPAIKIIMLKISTFLRDIPILFHKNGGFSFVFCNFALEKGKVAAGGCSLVII